jgi:DNA processing protein
MTTAASPTSSAADVPDGGHLASLAGFRGMGPRRLRLLLSHHEPAEAFRVASGTASPHPMVARALTPALRAAWRADARARPPGECWEACGASAVSVIPLGAPGYPAALLDDPVPPAVLFVRGDPAAVERRRVGVIGTRNATRAGLDTAEALGAALAGEGVAVVSGLARGIDGAAHRGALAGAGVAIAVVGNGPDRPYPRQHAALWEQVCASGVLMSEWPPGTRPDAFRFPMRNRILAALCEVLVVVESRETGGSLVTVREALDRSVTVMAVPGSPSCRAARGTNALLRDGAAPVTCADDVLDALGLDSRRAGGARFDPRPAPRGDENLVLERCRVAPCTLGDVVDELGIEMTRAAMALARLERSGWLQESGGWFEVVGSWSGTP